MEMNNRKAHHVRAHEQSAQAQHSTRHTKPPSQDSVPGPSPGQNLVRSPRKHSTHKPRQRKMQPRTRENAISAIRHRWQCPELAPRTRESAISAILHASKERKMAPRTRESAKTGSGRSRRTDRNTRGAAAVGWRAPPRRAKTGTAQGPQPLFREKHAPRRGASRGPKTRF